MIFIDKITRLNQLPEHDDFTHFKRRRSRTSNDSLTLSDAAAHVQQVFLSNESDDELTPTDSIIANMLETLLQQLDRTDITVEALTRMAPQNELWQVTLQTPPIGVHQSASATGYSDAKANPQLTSSRTFEFRIYGAGNIVHNSHITFTVRHLAKPLQQALQKLAPMQSIQTPYSETQLTSLPNSWTFELDQDGEPNPLESLYDIYGTRSAHYEPSYLGLQIWFERQRDALPLLISDQRLGYVYIGNYEVFHSREESSERPSGALGDIDTSA